MRGDGCRQFRVLASSQYSLIKGEGRTGESQRARLCDVCWFSLVLTV